MRRTARVVGSLMIVAGLALLAWALVVWRWEDPFTMLYTRYEQRELASDYERRVAAFDRRPVAPAANGGDPRAGLQAEARRYRKSLQVGDALGRLNVPKLGLRMIVVDGTDSATLKKGPGRYRGSFLPGEGGLIYIAGHRTTYSAPFARIDTLRPGDRVTFDVPYGTFEYAVTRSTIVPATALEVLRSRGREVLALQACHPRFFASHRYITYAKPVGFAPRRGGAQREPAAASR